MDQTEARTTRTPTRSHRFLGGRRDRGASLVEYALLVTLIAMVCLVAVMFFGAETSKSFSATTNSIANP